MPCDYPGCRATSMCTTTIYRPHKHPRLCPEHMRLLSESLAGVERRRLEGAVKRWWIRNCRPKKGVL